MSSFQLKTGQIVYDPRGFVESEVKPLAPRLSSLTKVELGILDNTKWNGGKLLRKIIDLLVHEGVSGDVHYYKKESFSRNAAPELIKRIAAENEAVITAIGD